MSESARRVPVSNRRPFCTLRCPPGFLWDGSRVKLFTSVEAFMGYVRMVERFGYVVTFSGPFAATVSRPLL